MYQKIRNRTEGFTIIEVLIVLAIAGLIMLIVFLAVPALQRNSRNNARNNDASRIAAAARECYNNRNGGLPAIAACQGAGIIDGIVGTRSQLTGGTDVNGPAQYQTTFAAIVWGSGCSTTGDAAAGSGEIAITYALESSGASIPRCITG